MKIEKLHIPVGKLRPGTKIVPGFLTIHSTGNPDSTAKNERDWLVNPKNDRIASWHLCVDENVVVEAIPLDEMAYHAGTSEGNKSSISIEICESGNRTKTILNAVSLSAMILFERGWGIAKLRRHYDWSKKICPYIFSANNWEGWNGFVRMVELELEKIKNNQVSDWAKDAWNWACELKIFDGTNPKDYVTREMLATVLYRFYQLKKN